MGPYPNWLRNSLLTGCALALPALAAVVPAGTQLQVRLKTKIASNTSKPDDPVETTVIAPVMVNGALAIPAGVTLRGLVTGASAATDPAVRATLALDFRELEMGGQRVGVHTLLTVVENARESVNDKGEIQGILANETLSSRMDSGIGKVAEKYSGFGGFLSAAKNAVFKETEGDISYDSGVEMDLKLTAALTLTGAQPSGPDAALPPVADRQALIHMVNRQPFQSRAQNPPKPSDITTLMFIGSQEQLQGAFADAGWSQASKLGEKSKFETLRAIVFHVKNGREHCHAIWSRIDPDAAKAVHIDHDRFKLQAVAREFARDHGLTLPPGMRKNGRSNKDKESNYQEKQQQERSGISKEERTKAITAVWQEHNKDPHAFVKALEEKGYHLANGDSGRYVVIDHAGEVHSLYRQIEGTRSNEVKAFLGADYPLDKLRDVETARTAALQGKKEQAVGKEEPQARPEDDAAGKREQEATARREELARRHEERRSRLDLKRAEMEKRMGTERAALLDLHTAEKDGVLAARAEKQPRGMLAFLSRITGIDAYITARHGRQDAAREQAHKADREALDRRHGRDRQEMERRYTSLAAGETRERQSLAIALKRQEFQKAREIIAGSRVLPESQLKPEFDRAVNPAEARQGEGDSRAAKGEQLLHDFENAADPQKAGQTTGDSGKSPKGRLAGLFSRVAQPFTKGDLQRAFERAKDPERKPAPEPQPQAEEIDHEKPEPAAADPERLRSEERR